MEPGSVRKRILDDHQSLRGRVAEVDLVVRRALAGESGLVDVLRGAGVRLQAEFLDHLDLEDRLLVPALRGADAWGEERAERVEREHREQRAEMARILEVLSDPDCGVTAVAEELAALLEWLLRDMAHEEAAVLEGDLLRDDVIAVDVEAG